MYQPPDMSIWQGRIDSEETPTALRWHQKVKAWNRSFDLEHANVLLGFVCDEGVRRNLGRPGARNGPAAIRSALANLAYFQSACSYDAGDVVCNNQDLEQAQATLVEQVSNILQHNGFPIILGGGHEMAWGSFLGLTNYLNNVDTQRRIGIINFDAHFDLRNPQPQSSSGTPFRQIAQWCDDRNKKFNYMALGINQSANTAALFEYAKQKNVRWVSDADCTLDRLDIIEVSLANFLNKIDDLYLTICLDVFPASVAPGVSAPAAVGVDPFVIIKLIQMLKALCKEQQVICRLSDIAELNPDYDQDNQTANLAARLIHEFASDVER